MDRANRILDVQENLPEDETPPEWMWFCDNEIEIWFNTLKKNREEKYNTETEPDEDPGELVQNDLVKSWGPQR